jgi:diguanylate cyclase (GGDEF)-like protein
MANAVLEKDEKLKDEAGRLAALRRYQILDTPRESGFDKITSLVRTVLDVPICAVSLVDRDRQWFKSLQGLDAEETSRDVAFCDHTIRTRDPLVVNDASEDPRFVDNALVTADPHIRSYAGVPLRTPDGYNLGALCVIDTKPHDFTEAQVSILRNFADLVMDELELRTIAHKDFLTGAATRRAFVDGANHEIDRMQRTGHACSLVLFDIDHFKSVNDKYGHSAGDTVLIAVATLCEQSLRPTDLLGRVGGEEFAILMPDTEIDNAMRATERLRRSIAEMDFPQAPDLKVTVSFGVSRFKQGLDFPGWLALADEALYDAKRGGRNQTVAAA